MYHRTIDDMERFCKADTSGNCFDLDACLEVQYIEEFCLFTYRRSGVEIDRQAAIQCLQ